MAQTTQPRPVEITCWMLDTRQLWPGTKITSAAPEALQLISESERTTITRKYHIADAKMSLGSALLKRLYIHRTLNIPWKEIKLGRLRDPVHGKPCALLPNGSPAPIEFNVSHQAGLVTLVGASTTGVQLGTDIVCVNERNDYRLIDAEGFDGWVDVYQEIFSPEEQWDMKYNVDPFKLLDGTVLAPDNLGRHDRCCVRDKELSATLNNGQRKIFSSDLLIDAKLRRFYTFWCYKEAYIKLDGEALLAKWIKELEFRNVHAPNPGAPLRCSTLGAWGERVRDAEVWFQQKQLKDVTIEIQSFEEKFMISAAAKPSSALNGEGFPDFDLLDLESDIMDVARKSVEGKVDTLKRVLQQGTEAVAETVVEKVSQGTEKIVGPLLK